MKKNSLLLLSLLTILAWSCKKEKEPENPIEIGKFYQGGYIFYIDGTGQHGIVLAPPYTERITPWGCNTTYIGVNNAQNFLIGSGAGNTYAIVGICNDQNGAAQYCSDYLINGYSDWFLPSIVELDSAIQKLRKISIVDIKENQFFWSSTEGQVPNAEAYTFCNSSNPNSHRRVRTNKASPGVYLRPVRNF